MKLLNRKINSKIFHYIIIQFFTQHLSHLLLLDAAETSLYYWMLKGYFPVNFQMHPNLKQHI